MEDEIELSLELSIGGCYGKSENPKNYIEGKANDPFDKGDNSDHNVSRSDFSCDKNDENGCEFVDLQRKREIQALRRREARMKREVKKIRGLNNCGFLEDKLILEAQQFQTRVQDREIREKDETSENSARKKDKYGRKEVVEDLNISLSAENKVWGTDFAGQQMQTQFLFPEVQYLPVGNSFAYPWVVPLWGRNGVEEERSGKNAFRPMANGNGSGNSSIDCDSGNEPENRRALSSRSVERSSSVVSDHRSASQRGGSSSEAGSHSSSCGAHQNHFISRRDKIEHPEGNDSSPQTDPGQCVGRLNPEQSMKVASPSIQQLESRSSKMTDRSQSHTRSIQTCSTAEKPSSPPSKETSGLINSPPKPPNHNQNGASIQCMPCVSTTGNGPNGKTITGFLYKYTKSEVSIMCVCHGSSFSPAEFVEHAGGVDISHPLRHITIVPSALG